MQTLTDDLMGVTILYQRYIRDSTCIQVNEGAEDFHDRDTQRSVFFFQGTGSTKMAPKLPILGLVISLDPDELERFITRDLNCEMQVPKY